MKNKAFILDFNLLEEHDISAEEFLLLISYHSMAICQSFIGKLSMNSKKCSLLMKSFYFLK